MRPVKTAVAAALLAGLAVLAGGCGGDDGSTTAGSTAAATAAAESGGAKTAAPATTEESSGRPEPPADQSRWAKQVDAACTPWQDRINAVAPPVDLAGLERWLADTLPLVRKQVAAVKAVKPPVKEEEARRAKLFVAGLEKLERSLMRYLAAIRAGKPAAVQEAVVDTSAAGSETRGYAVSLDLTECGGYSAG